MQDLLIAIICFCGAGAAFALGVLMVKHRRAARAWAQEKAAIAECAHCDEVIAEQLQLLRYIHQHWPEAIRVSLDSQQRFTPEVDALLHGASPRWAMLEAMHLERPGSVYAALNSRQHKMQICDAARLGLRVTVEEEGLRAGRRNPREDEVGAGREVAGMGERMSAR